MRRLLSIEAHIVYCKQYNYESYFVAKVSKLLALINYSYGNFPLGGVIKKKSKRLRLSHYNILSFFIRRPLYILKIVYRNKGGDSFAALVHKVSKPYISGISLLVARVRQRCAGILYQHSLICKAETTARTPPTSLTIFHQISKQTLASYRGNISRGFYYPQTVEEMR
jgi:hypothetical protein